MSAPHPPHMPSKLFLLPLLLALLTLSGCSSDTSLPDVPQHPVRLRLELAAASTAIDTRAWNDTYATDGEMMNSAYVVMVKDADRTVSHIFHVTPTATESEREVVTYITDERGKYSFYSFGNVAPTSTRVSSVQTADATDNETLQSITIDGLTFTVGSAAPTADALAAATSTAAYNLYKRPSTGLPMSNSESYNVSADTTIVLQLVRRMAKLRFTLKNATGSAVAVSGITLSGITKDATPQYLFPRRLANGNSTAVFTGIDSHATADLACYAPGDDAPLALAASEEKLLDAIYLNESAVESPTGTFPLTLRIRREGETAWLDRHALLNLKEIPRNTFVDIPLTVTDYDVVFRAWLYPPIGGYPSVNITRQDDEFYATFSGEGDFMVTAQIYALADRDAPEKWFSLLNTDRVTLENFTVNDPSGIFSTAPHIDATTGEILGTLSGASGTASARFSLTIKVNDAQTQVYNRTIYFVVK